MFSTSPSMRPVPSEASSRRLLSTTARMITVMSTRMEQPPSQNSSVNRVSGKHRAQRPPQNPQHSPPPRTTISPPSEMGCTYCLRLGARSAWSRSPRVARTASRSRCNACTCRTNCARPSRTAWPGFLARFFGINNPPASHSFALIYHGVHNGNLNCPTPGSTLPSG